MHLKHLQGFIMGCVQVILGFTKWDQKGNTELQSIGNLEKVKVMIMRRRWQWLVHLERLADCRIPKCLLVCTLVGGKHAVGGQKRRWNDNVMRDLKRCDLISDWHDFVQERGAWWGLVRIATTELNNTLYCREGEKG